MTDVHSTINAVREIVLGCEVYIQMQLMSGLLKFFNRSGGGGSKHLFHCKDI